MGKKLPRILPKVATSALLLGSFTCRKFTMNNIVWTVKMKAEYLSETLAFITM